MIPDWLTLVFWARLPVAATRLSPSLASVLTDGVYLVRGTLAGAGLPVLCLLLGLLAGAAHAGETFTGSLLVLGFLGVAGMLSAHLGLWSTLGYAVGDLTIHDHTITGPQGWVALLASYGLLALLTVYLPLLVGTVRLAIRRVDVKGNPPILLELLAAALAAGAGMFIWSQALRVLILPVFTWQGLQNADADAAVLTLRDRWPVLVGILMIAAALRVWRETTSRGELVATHVAELRTEFAKRAPRPVRSWPRPVTTGAGAALLTLVVAGLIASPIQALLVLAFFAALLYNRDRPIIPLWSPTPTGMPGFLRPVLAMTAGYGISWLLMRAASGPWPAVSWPALAGACLTVALVSLAAVQPRETQP
ncbi:MAG: hypothetical protein ACRD0K_13745 [Egibacteraceae bacterium]